MSVPALPLTTRTGICLVFSETFKRLSTSMPDPPGMLISKTMRLSWVRSPLHPRLHGIQCFNHVKAAFLQPVRQEVDVNARVIGNEHLSHWHNLRASLRDFVCCEHVSCAGGDCQGRARGRLAST